MVMMPNNHRQLMALKTTNVARDCFSEYRRNMIFPFVFGSF